MDLFLGPVLAYPGADVDTWLIRGLMWEWKYKLALTPGALPDLILQTDMALHGGHVHCMPLHRVANVAALWADVVADVAHVWHWHVQVRLRHQQCRPSAAAARSWPAAFPALKRSTRSGLRPPLARGPPRSIFTPCCSIKRHAAHGKTLLKAINKQATNRGRGAGICCWRMQTQATY